MVVGRRPLNSKTQNVTDDMWIFNDKKLLITDQKTNGRAERLIKDCEETFMVERSQHLDGLTVLGAGLGRWNVMTPHIFGPGEIASAETYIHTC